MTQSSSRRGVTEACSHCVLLAEASPIPIAPDAELLHMPCHASMLRARPCQDKQVKHVNRSDRADECDKEHLNLDLNVDEPRCLRGAASRSRTTA